MDRPLISIIILNWNGKYLLESCLPTLFIQTYPSLEIIIVDNGSTDGSIEFLKARYCNKVKIIECKKNLGFTIANNIGILKSKGKHVLILNNDTQLEEDCLNELLKVVESNDRIGMCAPKILMQSNDNRIDSVGHILYPDGLSRQRGRLEVDRGQYNAIEEVIFPSACCGLYRRKMLDEIGLFDEEFFIYVDDTDLGLRARLAGWRCIYVPKAIVFHRYSSTVGGYSFFKAFLVERNRIWLIIKLFPLPLLFLSFYYTLKRYLYQFYGVISNKGSAAVCVRQHSKGNIISVISKAYFAALCGLPKMLNKRKKIQSTRKVKLLEMYSWFKKFGITAKELALKE